MKVRWFSFVALVLRSRRLTVALRAIFAELETLRKVTMPFSASYSGCIGAHLATLSFIYEGSWMVMVLNVGTTFFNSLVTFTRMVTSAEHLADVNSRISYGAVPV